MKEILEERIKELERRVAFLELSQCKNGVIVASHNLTEIMKQAKEDAFKELIRQKKEREELNNQL